VVEISLAEMTKAVVMLGNSQLRAEMDSNDPVNTGQLLQTLIPVVRECLDSIMLVSEQRLADGFAAIHLSLLLWPRCKASRTTATREAGSTRRGL
jgi:hypothetical protein